MGNKLVYPEVDLSGKVALVTGGNTGVGYETAKGLARLGAHTFIACRSEERAKSAIERIKQELTPKVPESGNEKAVGQGTLAQKESDKKDEPQDDQKKDEQPDDQKKDEQAAAVAEGSDNKEEVPKKDEDKSGAADGQGEITEAAENSEEVKRKVEVGEESKVKVEYIPLDLASFQSTKECVRIFKERNLPLHILVNNAAVLGPLYTTTGDNLEMMLQVNHLGPVLLTLELLPVLLETAASSGDVRVLFVSSSGHSMAEPFDVDQLNKTEDRYKRIKNYCNTKLYNVMSGYCLQRRLENKNITVSSIHPGFVRTELTRNSTDMKFLYPVVKVASSMVARNPKEGAATSLNSAVNPKLNSQQHFYYDSCQAKVSSQDSRNEVFQEQLWKKTFEYLKDHLSSDIYEKYGPKSDNDQPAEEGTEEALIEEKEVKLAEDKKEIPVEEREQQLTED